MNDELPDGGFSIESLGEDIAEQARRELSLLEKSLGTAVQPADTAALLDEAYRGAHSLKLAVDSRRMPNVDRLARRVQDVVRATRSGVLSVTPELGSMLASIARIARDALDAGLAGGAEPASAASAAATLEEMLAHPGAWTVPPDLSGAPMRWARVDASRLHSAGEAAAASRAAASAYSRAARDSTDLTEKFLSALTTHEQALQTVRDALPDGLGRAARGEPTAAIAGELAEMISALDITAAELRKSLSRGTAAVREAAALGALSAEKAESAFSSLRSIKLYALLEDLPRMVRRTSRNAGRPVDLELDPTNLEVHASKAETVGSLVKTCARLMIGHATVRPGTRRRRDRSHPSRLSIFARAAGESLYLRMTLAGGAAGAEQLTAKLAPARKKLARTGGTLEVERPSPESVSILLTIRSAAAVTSRSAEFILARAGESWYAILASSVVECIEAGMAMPDYVVEGTRLPTLRMNDTRDPRQGVVVRTPRGGAVLLFDVVGGREVALATTGGGDSAEVAGISGSVRRPDGTTARLVDLAVLLPSP